MTRYVLLAALFLSFTTPTRAQSVDARAFIERYYSVYNAAGAPKLADFYNEDAIFEDPSFGLDLHGRAQIGGLLTSALAKYETLDHKVLRLVQAGDEVTVEGLMVARLNGKPLNVRYMTVFRFKNGKIQSQNDLYDLLHYFEQLGVVPRQFQRPQP